MTVTESTIICMTAEGIIGCHRRRTTTTNTTTERRITTSHGRRHTGSHHVGGTTKLQDARGHSE